MNRKALVVVSIVLIIISVLIFEYINFLSTPSHLPENPVPPTYYTTTISLVNSPEIPNEAGPPPDFYANITRGNELKISINVTSTGLSPVLVIVQKISVWWYNPTVNLSTWYWPPNNSTDTNIQESAFSYSASPNSVNLQLSSSNSTIITLNIAKDAPVGQYSMYINLETELPQSNGTYALSAWGPTSYWFAMIINPK